MNENGITIKRQATEKEISLVQMLADDKKPKDIAKEWKKSVKTIQYEIDVLKTAYGCKGFSSLIVLFFRNGLIK